MKTLFLLAFSFAVFTSQATTYYFSASGNDANNGTSTTTPWKTIAKFNSVFASKSAGDNFLFNRGDVFYGSLIISRSGSSGLPITIGAYGTGANPVITGFTNVTAWTNLGSNVWESSSAVSTLNDVNIVVINGINTAMGRYPNSGYLTYQSHVGRSSITSSSLTGSPNWTGADVVMKTWNFAIARNLITAQSGGTLSYNPTTVDNGNDGFGFFIENDARTLDVQNEWYYNPTSRKISIYSTSSPANVQVSSLDTLVYMVTRSNITFDGIDFTGSNKRAFYIGSCSNITIQNCNFNYHGLYAIWGGNNHGSASSNFNFNHNSVNHINSQAIYLQNEFTNTYIGYNSFKNTGVLPGMFKIPISGGQWGGAYGCIRTQNTDNLIVEYNDIDSSGYTAIHFTGNNTRINNNQVQHWETELMDGAAIYTWTGPNIPTTGSKIYNNIVGNAVGTVEGTPVKTVPLVHGIYTDDNTANTEVYSNTIFNIPYAGIYIHNTYKSNVHNNTIYNAGKTGVLFEYRDYPIRNDTFKNNIIVAKDIKQLIATFQSKTSDITSFFTAIDSNYYARPIDDNTTFYININNSTFFHYNLAQWKTYLSKDANSKKSPKTITKADDLKLEYNPTKVNKTIALDGNYIDVKNVSYNGTITLAPYTSVVLIKK